jgi:hypothetical protein
MGTVVRRPYETATVLDQTLLDQSQDSLSQRLEMITEIDTPTGTLFLSDRAKYVDDVFYENRVEFPTISRTVGEFLAGELEFSGLEITVNNTDKKYSDVLQGGANFNGWINRRVEVKIGLAEIGSSYVTVFEGFVTDVGGYSRDTSTFTLSCRNKFDSVNVTLPNQVLIEDDFPDIEDDFIGLGAPVIYGDWTTDIRPEAPAVPAFPVNGNDPLVNASLDPVDPNVGDNPLRLVIGSTPLKSLDTSSITLFRGDQYYTFAPGDITILGGSNNTIFDITQKNLIVDGSPWIYETGDEFFVKCVGVELGGGTYDDNIVEQARDILIRFGGLVAGDFTSSWDTLRDKNSPAQSAIANIPSRIWFQESAKAIELAAALLEQVRCEPYIDRENKWDLCAMHFDTFEAAPSFVVKNWDVNRASFKPQIDERNNFNRAQADFDFNPAASQNRRSTPIFKNDAAITQAGKPISKLITFPNLYKIDDVQNQLIEILRLVSSYSEMVDVTLTSRAFLKDICDFVQLSIDIGSIEFDATGQPIVGMIRDLSYTPKTMGIGAKIWMFQMVNFPGYTGPAGTVGGYDATITQET